MISKISQELFETAYTILPSLKVFFPVIFFFHIEFSSELELQWSFAQKAMSII